MSCPARGRVVFLLGFVPHVTAVVLSYGYGFMHTSMCFLTGPYAPRRRDTQPARHRRMVARVAVGHKHGTTERSNRATMNSPCRRGGLTHAAGPASLTRSVDIWRRPYAPITRPGGAGRRPRPAPAAATTRSARALRRALSPCAASVIVVHARTPSCAPSSLIAGVWV
ncbi:hypothetical protein Ctob_000206 [Chrysochromulina tobinii]|uniref:Uncharacterized protein n=1 Tax=Chrysochromulina tobinii TaxID=1460289 RepID=A0A0M0J9N7_9EUKA|nr:hypothetical protein Ctob_000206 [Chrysochromulina tobinii]|eukprot:KOO23314.1 hypothetical protein Ctob_000206 [Chrysochromulina sp. CCMP291]